MTAVTFWQYALAHREGQPGGYLPIAIGAVLVGFLTMLCSYLTKPHNPSTAIVSGVISTIAFAVVMLGALISCFGS